MSYKIEKLKKIFSEDLQLAGYFLILEAIQTNTLQSIRLISIRSSQGIANSAAVKNSKILKLNKASQVAANFVKRSFSISGEPNIDAFKEKAGKLIAALEFYYLLEDLSTTLLAENVGILKAYSEYNDEGTSATKQVPEQEPLIIPTEEKIEDPTIEILLGSNESKAMILRLMKVFRYQVQITKDVPSMNFFNSVKDLRNKSFIVIPSNDYRPIAVDITKLTFSQFQNLVKILQVLGGMISKIRIAIGSSNPNEIRKNLLGEPNK